jgi:hypothetical protein
MQLTATDRRGWLSRRMLFRGLAATLAFVLLVAAVGLLANSRLPRRAAGIYGGLFENIRRRPGVTAIVCFTGVALIWGGIGVAAAIEGRGERKSQE